MKIPEFTAQASLYKARNSHRSLTFDRASAQSTVVTPQLGGPNAPGHAGCLNDCADQHPAWTRAQCAAACKDPIGAPCKPHDNSINNLACLIGVNTWEGNCGSDCLTFASGGLVGAAAAALCVAGCHISAEGFRSDCPPAVICLS